MSAAKETKPRRMPVAVALDPAPTTRAESAGQASNAPKAPASAPSRGQARAPRAVRPAAVTFSDDAFETPEAGQLVTPDAPRRRFPLGAVFLSAASALFMLWLGAALTTFITDLVALRPELGYAAAALAAIAAAALLGVVIREWLGLMRLDANSGLSARAVAARAGADAAAARAVIADMRRIAGRLPATAAGRARLDAIDTQFLSAGDLLSVAERELLEPLDALARGRVVDAAKRVSVVTAVSPRAFVDVGYVLFENARLIRAVAEIYGCRPGALGFVRLARATLAHLAVTGVIAMGDSLVQQVVGHGLAARISARLGEGVLNGVMTARIGFAAMDVARPMPFAALPRPGVGAVMAELAPRAPSA